MKGNKLPKEALLNDMKTDLLDSCMRAMAMRILVRRKMRVRRRMASTTDMIITEDGGHIQK